jgi:hypothetical protein
MVLLQGARVMHRRFSSHCEPSHWTNSESPTCGCIRQEAFTDFPIHSHEVGGNDTSVGLEMDSMAIEARTMLIKRFHPRPTTALKTWFYKYPKGY